VSYHIHAQACARLLAEHTSSLSNVEFLIGFREFGERERQTERERETERQRDGERERETERETIC
jgi:hypothetical protein